MFWRLFLFFSFWLLIPSLSYANTTFSDLSSHHPHYGSVMDLVGRGVLQGYPDGSFKPDATINRAELVKIMVESSYMKEDKEGGGRVIVNESGEVDECNDPTSSMLFPDVRVDQWYSRYLCFAKKKGFISGYDDGSFKPSNPINFAEAAKVIVNAMELGVSSDGSTSGSGDGGPWFKPFVEKLEEAKAIPLTIYSFSTQVTRSDISNIYSRLLTSETPKEEDTSESKLTLTYTQIDQGIDHYVTMDGSKSTYVNIRSSKSSAGALVGKLKAGEYVKAIGSADGDWQKIKTLNGKDGYVHTDYIKNDAMATYIIPKLITERDGQKLTSSHHPKRPCRNLFEWKLKNSDEKEVLISFFNEDGQLRSIDSNYLPYYEKMGGGCGPSGPPISDKGSTGSSVSGDNSGHYQAFEHGRIYEFNGNIQFLTGDLFYQHENENSSNRGTWGNLGFPTGEAKLSDGQIWQDFETGSMQSDTTDYWYMAIKDWATEKSDPRWGGVFKAPIYSEDQMIETLFPEKSGTKHKELIVKVMGKAYPYDETDPAADLNKKAMNKNYRTDRWYRVYYGDDYSKIGFVPVSATIWKNEDLYSVAKGGTYEIANSNTYQKNKACLGAYSKTDKPIDKLLLHNSNGYGTLALGESCAVHYYQERNDPKYNDKFVIRVPEYLNSASSGLGSAERRAISIEMVNVEWANPQLSLQHKVRKVKNGKFYSFNLDKLKKYNEIKGEHFNLVNYYFSENDGFYEVFNHNKLTQEGQDLKNEIRSDRDTFFKFYEGDIDDETGEPIFSLIDPIDNSNNYKNIYEVLNKIPFNYKFFNSHQHETDYSRIIDPRGTFPFKTYRLDSSKRSQPMTDHEDADYYEKYTIEQYANLDLFINHMYDKYGIPKKTFSNDLPEGIPSEYAFYYATGKSDFWNENSAKVSNFSGIISHRISTKNGKMCPAPGFQIDRLPSLNH